MDAHEVPHTEIESWWWTSGLDEVGDLEDIVELLMYHPMRPKLPLAASWFSLSLAHHSNLFMQAHLCCVVSHDVMGQDVF